MHGPWYNTDCVRARNLAMQWDSRVVTDDAARCARGGGQVWAMAAQTPRGPRAPPCGLSGAAAATPGGPVSDVQVMCGA